MPRVGDGFGVYVNCGIEEAGPGEVAIRAGPENVAFVALTGRRATFCTVEEQNVAPIGDPRPNATFCTVEEQTSRRSELRPDATFCGSAAPTEPASSMPQLT